MHETSVGARLASYDCCHESPGLNIQLCKHGQARNGWLYCWYCVGQQQDLHIANS